MPPAPTQLGKRQGGKEKEATYLSAVAAGSGRDIHRRTAAVGEDRRNRSRLTAAAAGMLAHRHRHSRRTAVALEVVHHSRIPAGLEGSLCCRGVAGRLEHHREPGVEGGRQEDVSIGSQEDSPAYSHRTLKGTFRKSQQPMWQIYQVL